MDGTITSQLPDQRTTPLAALPPADVIARLLPATPAIPVAAFNSAV
jgi:hypothetical protein